jgi:hypothetical protein
MSDIQDNRPLLTPKQVAQKGEQIYQEKLKPILEPKENGKFVTIEVNSGEYFLGDSLLEALQQARQKYPDRLFHTIKVGAEGVFKMGTYGKHLSYGWKS